jgi:hypothetical protein
LTDFLSSSKVNKHGLPDSSETIKPQIEAPREDGYALDFTEDEYRRLLRVAKREYKFVSYAQIAFDQKFILWRHDVDSSLNRALRLAEIEQEEGVRATYFINPHCQFYNFLERSQLEIIRKIINLGHFIGLHFDSDFYGVKNEDELDVWVLREARVLEEWIGVKIETFSFHNPDSFLLSCEREAYGGVRNCYSAQFKASVPYCSDSNGYWRFRRLTDVLSNACDPCLQVLTHPEWWQVKRLYPRERIFRSIFGRAAAVLWSYDRTLLEYGRSNLSGPAANVGFLREFDIRRHELYDYLWNMGQHETLLVELFRLHNLQVRALGEMLLVGVWQIPRPDVEGFFRDAQVRNLSGGELFELIFETPWAEVTGSAQADYCAWTKLCKSQMNGGAYVSAGHAEKACVFFSGVIERLAGWGQSREDIASSGLAGGGVKQLQPPQTTSAPVADQKVEADPSYLAAWGDLKARCVSHAKG